MIDEVLIEMVSVLRLPVLSWPDKISSLHVKANKDFLPADLL